MSGKIKDMTGQRFGKLLVLHVTSPFRCTRSGTMWECLCDCGKSCFVYGTRLRTGNTKSCGCFRKEMFKKRPYEATYNYLADKAKTSGHELSLSYDDFLEFTKQSNCHYCGLGILWKPHWEGKRQRYSLDRKDNSLGYSRENCVVCCKDCNYAKGNRYTYEEWVVMTAALKGLRNGNNTSSAAASA